MNPERWQRVNAVFAQVIEAAEDERPDRLRALSAEDPLLRAEVESLLRADALAGTSVEPFLQRVLLATPENDGPGEGARIGPYRLVREIGRGGMGLVYLAERADEFRMAVAIKIVRGGFGDSLRVRFNRERQILANLDHPNIAKLLDGGTTADGSPYLVMEYVDGEPITSYCEKRQLGTAARLKLFERVCEAVHHAHRHLIIHRDLKPGNILVTGEGVPKLLDFGVAKLLDAGESAPGQTLTGFQPMTPAYASPEQASGQAMTTATDVYSLGVILFELVTGARPYQITSTSPLEIQRTLMETQPMAPSRLRPGLSRDIDSIVRMAMKKEPERRYVSAAAFAEDLRLHLGSFPIVARADSRSYQLSRFVRRHRGLVVAASLAAAALTTTSLVAVWQSRQASTQRARSERRFAEARRIANSMVFELHDEIVRLPGATKARGVLLLRASEWLDTLAADAPNDPQLDAELAESYHRLGRALGASGMSNLGDTRAALAAQRKALALREKLAARWPDDREHQDRLATTHREMAYAIETGPGALVHAQSAVRISTALHQKWPADPELKSRLGQSHFAEALIRVQAGDLAGGERGYRLAGDIFEATLRANPARPTAQRNVSLINKHLGAIMFKQDRMPEALGYYEKAFAADQAIVAGDPKGFQARYDLSVSRVELGGVRSRGNDRRGALKEYGQALVIREQLLKEDPANALARQALASVLMRMAAAHNLLGEFDQALASLLRAEPLLRAGTRDREKGSLADAHRGMAFAYRGQGRTSDAIGKARSAVEARLLLLGEGPGDAFQVESLALDLVELGSALAASGLAPAREESCRSYREAEALISGIRPKPTGLDMARLFDQVAEGLRICGPPGLRTTG